MAIQSEYQAQSAFTWRGVNLFCPDQSEVSDILQSTSPAGSTAAVATIEEMQISHISPFTGLGNTAAYIRLFKVCLSFSHVIIDEFS